MSCLARRRGADGHCDEGAYAILYALLTVVLLALGAIVVDTANVRSDRRLDRSATDSASVGGARLLGGSGASAKAACLKAWDYLATSLRLTSVPVGACTSFDAYATVAAVNTYCAATSAPWPAEISDDRAIPGGRTVRIAWPIPYHSGTMISQFLTPDIAPGSLTQEFSTTVDGTDNGCDRLGVAIFEDESFGLGGGIGVSGTTTQVHSVARFNPSAGPSRSVAALNILNVSECDVIKTTGTGTVLVNPVVTGNTVTGVGMAAIESTGTATADDWASKCNAKNVITLGGGGRVCASSVLVTPAVPCDGRGIIQAHELDDGVNNNTSSPGDSNTCASDSLCPAPTPEFGTYRWNPVTEIYGCNTTVLNPCATPATNYVANLETAFGLSTSGSAPAPTPYAGSAPYPNPYPGAFTTINTCNYSGSGASATVLAAGNYYFNCNGLNVPGTLIIGGGNVVLRDGNLSVGGCFIFNAAVTSASATGDCANVATNGTVVGSGDVRVTTNPAPVHDGILFLRGGSIEQNGRMLLPQVFTYSKASRLDIGGGPLTLWTAPGGGALVAGGRTQLQEDCYVSATNTVDDACLASRFSRVVYWNDFKSVQGGGTENKFVAQGTLNLVGVFFTPRGSFHFGGGNCLDAVSTQYWADDLTVEGGACVLLKPDTEFSETRPSGLSQLIR